MKLLKRSVIVGRYFFTDGSFADNVKRHQQVTKNLNSFIADKLISPKTPFIYLRKYISTALPVRKSLDILDHHYTFLRNNFSVSQLRGLYQDGIVCYEEEQYKIILSGSKHHEREGSLSLYFMDGDINIAILSFTISSGKTFGLSDEHVAVISRFQQIYANVERAREAKKHFQDVMPTLVTFSVFEAICVALGIKSVLGIYGKDQLSYDAEYAQAYTVNYDEFWMHNGGVENKFGYVMNCPFPQKDLLEVKQTHRNRARRKRERMEGVFNYCYDKITKLQSAMCTALVALAMGDDWELTLDYLEYLAF